MNDPTESRYDRKWLPRDQRIEMKLDALLASTAGAEEQYARMLMHERFPELYADSNEQGD